MSLAGILGRAATPAQALNPFAEFIARYRNDRVGFVRNVLGAEPEEDQEKVLQDLDNGETRISIKSGHGVGKTALLSWIILHFVLTREPCKVAVTAPSATQLFDALASEVKLWLGRVEAKMPALAGILTATSDRVFLSAAPESGFVTYRTSRKENPEALQGIHAEHVLLIADEASGVDEAVFEAAAGSMSTEGAITILAGNPTRATGFFHATHTKLSRLWKCYTIPCFKSKRVSKAYIDEEREYGTESNRYRIRVLGEFPLADDDTLIGRASIESAINRKVEPSRFDPVFWGLDVARSLTGDKSALAKRRGNTLLEKVASRQLNDLMQVVGWLKTEYDATPDTDKPEEIFVDVIGLGAGVVDRARELDLPVVGINVGESPSVMNSQAVRLRDEIWMCVRDWFATRMVCIPDDRVLVEELAQPRVAYTSSGKTKVESKDDMDRRGVGSPDHADAFGLTFARFGAAAAGVLNGSSWRKGKPLRRQNTRRV